MEPDLEADLCGQLDAARVAIARYLAEKRVGKRGIHTQRIRVIESIERVSADLQVHTFLESVESIVPDEFVRASVQLARYRISQPR